MARLLLIESDTTVRAVLGLILSRAGHQVVEVSDVPAGLKFMTQGAFDVVITHMVWPEQMGIDALVALRKSAPGLKVVATSGAGINGLVEYLGTAALWHVTRVIEKPFGGEVLLQAVDELLRDEPFAGL